MIRPRALLSLSAAFFLVSACTSDPITVVAEVDDTSGFESGLQSWVAVTEGDATVTQSTASASEGSGSVRLSFTDVDGGAAALITRGFSVEPDRAYDVEVVFDLLSADAGLAATPWTVRAGARSTQPTGAAGIGAVGDTGTDAGPGEFETMEASVIGTASSDGTLWVTLGVTQDGGGVRTYHLDQVRVILTRR